MHLDQWLKGRLRSMTSVRMVMISDSSLNDIVAYHFHVLGDHTLQLRQLTDCLADVGIVEGRHVACDYAHAEILSVIVGQLEQVEECWFSIALAVEIEVELLDESE